MFAADTYRIRFATEQDADAVRASSRATTSAAGRVVLIGEIDSVVTAALSLSDGRAVAEASPRTGHLVANLRARAISAWAYSATPSTSERLLAGLPAWYRATMVDADAAEGERVERESVLAHAANLAAPGAFSTLDQHGGLRRPSRRSPLAVLSAAGMRPGPPQDGQANRSGRAARGAIALASRTAAELATALPTTGRRGIVGDGIGEQPGDVRVDQLCSANTAAAIS